MRLGNTVLLFNTLLKFYSRRIQMEEGKIGTTTCIHMEIIHAYQRTSTVTETSLQQHTACQECSRQGGRVSSRADQELEFQSQGKSQYRFLSHITTKLPFQIFLTLTVVRAVRREKQNILFLFIFTLSSWSFCVSMGTAFGWFWPSFLQKPMRHLDPSSEAIAVCDCKRRTSEPHADEAPRRRKGALIAIEINQHIRD